MARRLSASPIVIALSVLVACSGGIPFATGHDAATDARASSDDGSVEDASDAFADASTALTVGCPTPIDREGRCVGSLSVGEATACAIVDGGGVRCWGWAGAGMFGEGPRVRTCPDPTSLACSALPVAARITGATSIVVGNRHVCAITDAVHCWGTTDDCAAGASTTPDATVPGWLDVPTRLVGTDGATTLRSYAGSDSLDTGTCARVGTQLMCWGPAGPRGATTCAPGVVWTGAFDAFFVGPWVSYGVRSGDAWQGWGIGFSLLPAGASAFASPTPLPVPAGSVEILVGRVTTCARTDAGRVFCWGQNIAGSLGLGMRDPARVPTPTEVTLPEPATHLSVSGDHACVLLASGRVACWGSEEHELLGQGPGAPEDCGPNPPLSSLPCASAPVLVDGLEDAIDLSTGPTSSCARRGSGRIVCWGANTDGQLGNGTFDDAASPTEVLGI